MTKYMGQMYLMLASSIWGSMYVVSKVLLEVVSPLELVWLRYIIAILSLAVLGFITGQSWKIARRDIPLILAIGVIGYFLSIWAQFAGTQLSSAQMGSVITAATPAFMVLFAHFLLQEKITLKKAVAICLATLGVLLIIGVGEFAPSFRLGGIVLGLAALTWALMSVLVKKVPKVYSQLVITAYSMLAAVLCITPLAWGGAPDFGIVLRGLSLDSWGGILYIGLVSTAGAFYFWNKGLQLVDAAQGSLFFFFQPLTGTLLGWLFLGEQVGLSFWLGTLLILGGVLLTLKAE